MNNGLRKPTSLEDFKSLIQSRKEVSKSFHDILHSFDKRFSIIQEEPEIIENKIAVGGTLV